MLILSILVCLFGIVMMISPTSIWKMTESWKSNDATEPSGLYLLSTRIGGVCFCLAGFGGIVVSIFV